MGFSQGFAPSPAPPTAPSRMTIALTSLQSGGFAASKTVTIPSPLLTSLQAGGFAAPETVAVPNPTFTLQVNP